MKQQTRNAYSIYSTNKQSSQNQFFMNLKFNMKLYREDCVLTTDGFTI